MLNGRGLFFIVKHEYLIKFQFRYTKRMAWRTELLIWWSKVPINKVRIKLNVSLLNTRIQHIHNYVFFKLHGRICTIIYSPIGEELFVCLKVLVTKTLFWKIISVLDTQSIHRGRLYFISVCGVGISQGTQVKPLMEARFITIQRN